MNPKPITLAALRRACPKGMLVREAPSGNPHVGYVWIEALMHGIVWSVPYFLIRAKTRQTARRAALAALKELKKEPHG